MNSGRLSWCKDPTKAPRIEDTLTQIGSNPQLPVQASQSPAELSTKQAVLRAIGFRVQGLGFGAEECMVWCGEFRGLGCPLSMTFAPSLR